MPFLSLEVNNSPGAFITELANWLANTTTGKPRVREAIYIDAIIIIHYPLPINYPLGCPVFANSSLGFSYKARKSKAPLANRQFHIFIG